MTARKGTSCLLAAALLLLGSCETYRVRAYGGYMQPRLTGTVALTPAPNVPFGTGVDLESGLGAGTEDAPYLRGEFGLGPFVATVSAFHYDTTGTGTLDDGFGGLPQGTDVRSEIEILNIKSAITYDIVHVGPFRLAPGFCVDYTDVEFIVEPTGFTGLERLEVQVPAPLAYVQAELDFDWVAATVDFGAMRVNLDEVDGDYLDFEAMLRISPIDNLEIFGGYRILQVDGTGEVDSQDYNADVELSGWFVGGGLTF